MPEGNSMWGWLTAIFKGLGEAFFGWLRERERDRLLQKETEERLRLIESEAARTKEEEIRRVQDQIRSESGPRIPDFTRLHPPGPPGAHPPP
jgi:hypothetical protein